MKKQGLESRLQFSVSGALKLTLVAAVFLAAVVPWLRQYDATQRRSVLLLWASAGASCCLVWIPNVYFRYRVERRGGSLRFVFSMLNRYFYFAMSMFFSFAAIAMLSLTTLAALFVPRMPDWWWWPYFMGGCAGYRVASATTWLWGRGARIELRDNGIGFLHQFVPWKKILSAMMDDNGGQLRIVRRGFLARPIKVTVAESLRPEVEEFLASVRPLFQPPRVNFNKERSR